MPSSNNAIGNLEFTDPTVPPGFLAVLNDRLRRIGSALSSLGVQQSWTPWKPTILTSGAMTVTAATGVTALYLVSGSVCYFRLRFTTTIGGTPGAVLQVGGLPIAELLGSPFICNGNVGGGVAVCYIAGKLLVLATSTGAGAFPAGSNTFTCSGAFQCA